MRLTSIRLTGFKSFVDPITVPFDGNMTAIVGPNGCGKSNIIDAVRWVMGESSARTLRGESMADVIFNGSTGRKPVGQAAIELKFDNRDGAMGGAYAQYSEIAVKRLVTRDGQSNYFFNGQKCRRRDIADLFMGTGLGPRSYALIGQGMISRLIEARPDDLRATLEEAAGISRYKERRRETENRMRRTQENLERLEDIREELDKQLERLKRQAEAAKRYQTLKSREHQLKGELALIRGRALRAEQTRQQARVRELETSVEKDVFGVRACETRLEQARARHDELAEVLERHQQQFFETTTRIARLEQDQAHRKSRESQLAGDIDTTRRDLDEQRRVSEDDRERLAAIDERWETLLPALEARDEQLEALEEALAGIKPMLESAEQRFADIDTRWRDASRDAERGQDHISDLEQRIKRLQGECARREQQRGELDDTASIREAHAQSARELESAERRTEQFQAEREQWQAHFNDTRTAHQAALAERDAKRGDLSRCQGELASLEALIDAAIADHDPDVQHKLKALGLDAAPRLGETLRAAPGWEPVVSWLLAPWLNARLVSQAALTALPEALATDWCLVDRAASGAHDPARLAAKVEGAGALGEWLARIHCVEGDDEARMLAGTLPPGESAVSRQGLWCGPGWLSQKASRQGVDALLITRRRFEEQRLEGDALEAALKALAERCDGLAESLESLEGERERHAEAEREHASQRQELAIKEQRLAQRLEHLQGRAAEIDDELATLKEEEATLVLSLEEQRERWGEAMANLEEAAAAREQSAEQRAGAREEFDRLNQQQALLKASQQALALERERLVTERDSLQAQQTRAGEAEQRLHQRLEELVEAREALLEPDELEAEALEELLHEREQRQARLNDTREQAQTLTEQLRSDELARQHHERTLAQSREQLQSQRMEVQALTLKAAAQDETLAELGHDIEALSASLADEAEASRWQSLLDTTSEKIRRLGAINLAAIEEYDQQAERRNYLKAQHAELTEALDTLAQAIKRIDQETRVRFRDTFEQVNAGLQALFPRVFGGGAAWLTLTGEDLLETGVAIMARPPGKKNSTIHLLSGGEKALTALSLVFAIFRLNPAPFCMLDEVDAPLDDANVGRYAKLVKEMSENVQFIYITHNKIAMEAAERLMGVTMQEPGVSRLVSVGIDEAAALVD